MGQPLPLGVGASGKPATGDQANAVVSGSFAAIGPGKPFEFWGPFNLAIWASLTSALTTTQGSSSVTIASGTGLAIGAAVNSTNVPRGTTLLTINTGTGAGTVALPTRTLAGININASSAVITNLPETAGLVGATVTGDGIPAATTVLSVGTAAINPDGARNPTYGTLTLSATPTKTLNGVTLEFALTNQAIATGVDAAASYTGVGITYSATIQLERSFDAGATWLVCGIGGQSIPADYNVGTPVSVTVGEPEKGVAYRLNCIAYTSGTISYRMSTTGAAALSLAVAASI